MICQKKIKAVLFGCAGTSLTPSELAFFKEVNPLGLILFDRNIQNPDQVKALTNAFRVCVGRADAPVLVDQEGGRVTRLWPPFWTAFGWAKTLGDIYVNDPKKALKLIENQAKTIYSRITSNKASLDNILKKLNEIKTVEEKWIWIKSLSNTANGNLSGKEKIMLETYIQMTYFDRIINRANTRFMVMSGGQYELKPRKEAENNRSQSGLELDVIDHYNGTERSVKTLSGGESFKASLSLALGLSDEIQSSAGGIKLDTMFVDEGFGSLDDESLAQAIKALSSLAEGNRLVGIISHVSELKDKIDKQIVVKKEKTGGSNISIVN